MVNDTNTLNGSLAQLGETLASNIAQKGVTASASDGLTTLASKILNIDDGSLFYDPCTSSNNKSSGYVCNVGSYSFDSDGLVIDASTLSGSNYQSNIRLDGSNVYTVPFEISFDLIEDGNDNFRLYFYNTSFSGSAIASGTLYTSPSGQTTKVRFVVTEDGITRYINNTSTTLSVSQTIATTVGARFGYSQTTQSNIKIRNYKVSPLGNNCSQYQQQIENAIAFINGDGS